jgi:hypothetical protein
MSMRRRRLVLPTAAIVAALGVTACGEDDHENDPRPPAPIEVTARIGKEVGVSPATFGAGIVNFTISNQSAKPATLTLEGPNDLAGTELPPGTVGPLKASLEEGKYEVSAGSGSDARATLIEVGPERRSSQNDLLLP